VGVERRPVEIETDGIRLPGDLTVPDDAVAVVVFAHGSGSSRLSPRNVQVAKRLHEGGLGTLLFDLLTEAESADRARVFDIPLLGNRLTEAVVEVRRTVPELRIGSFGASTGAAAALVAAANVGDVGAVVSRGGRPDLAGDALERVAAPTLLIVGGRDDQVLELNRLAQARMRCETRLEIVPGATHLFEEPGALDRVADLASGWFGEHLADPSDG
jgi:alpha-beta hydrolase superfamily lysophospholipase